MVYCVSSRQSARQEGLLVSPGCSVDVVFHMAHTALTAKRSGVIAPALYVMYVILEDGPRELMEQNHYNNNSQDIWSTGHVYAYILTL